MSVDFYLCAWQLGGSSPKPQLGWDPNHWNHSPQILFPLQQLGIELNINSIDAFTALFAKILIIFEYPVISGFSLFCLGMNPSVIHTNEPQHNNPQAPRP